MLMLKEFRETSGLKIAQMAERAGVSYETYRKWEQGRVMMNDAQLVEAADAFGVSVDYLLMVDVQAYDDDERELLSMYEDMNRKDRKVVLTLCRALRGPRRASCFLGLISPRIFTGAAHG